MRLPEKTILADLFCYTCHDWSNPANGDCVKNMAGPGVDIANCTELYKDYKSGEIVCATYLSYTTDHDTKKTTLTEIRRTCEIEGQGLPGNLFNLFLSYYYFVPTCQLLPLAQTDVPKDYISRKDVCRSNNCNTGHYDLGNLASKIVTKHADDYVSTDEIMSCIKCSGDLEEDPNVCWADSVELRFPSKSEILSILLIEHRQLTIVIQLTTVLDVTSKRGLINLTAT